MTLFYFSAAALVVAALLVLLRPWQWLVRNSSLPANAPGSTNDLNAAVHRDRLAELERDHANGTLSAKALTEARGELQRQLIDDTAGSEITTAPTSGIKAYIVVSLFVPLLGVALYATIGNPSALLPPVEAERHAQVEMEEAITRLAKKMETEPKPDGLKMLARSYKSLGRWDDALRTFERIGPELDNDPLMLAEYAEALVQKSRSFEGRPRELITKALQLDPNTMLALFLAGSDAIQERRYKEAADYWGRLLPMLDPEGEDARMISGALATARERAGLKVEEAPAKKAAAKTINTTKTAVSGTVELAPSLKDKVNPNDILFIFARAVNGPRMPLAALKLKASDLPITFSLDDQQAMSPEFKISSVNELRVEARISKTGQPLPSKGDLTGKSAILKPGTKGIRVVIDTAAD